MKTTENISLAGYAFVIETDAYSELEEYLNDIRSSFSGDSSAEEIVADIEERISELLRERCVSGMVVDLAMIREIKKRIGNPKELASEDSEPAFESTEAPQPETAEKRQKGWKNKRLYRNLDERLIGGVCSGLGTYFGLDKVIFRLFFLIFLIIGVAGWDENEIVISGIPLIYICLWIAMPAARTAEQKREMKGRPMNLNNYKAKDFDFEKEVKDVAQSPIGYTVKRAVEIFIGLLLLLMGLGGLVGGIFIPSIPSILLHEAADEIVCWGPLCSDEQFVFDLVTSSTFWGFILVALGLFCVGVIYGGVMLLFGLKAPSWRPGLVIFIAWLLSIFALAGWVIKTLADALPLIV